MAQYPKFIGNLIIKGKIECLTGLHIGGSKDKMEIGGVDSPVLRNPETLLPYIPGSSLKGKLRALLEYGLGVVDEKGDVSKDIQIVRIFGAAADDSKNAKDSKVKGPTRLIVRDLQPTEKTVGKWKKMDSELLYTEYKSENTINRITSAANPRFIERVVAGSEFSFEMVFGIYQSDEKDTQAEIQKDLNNLLKAMRLLESSTLGKSGSRGYGQIAFHIAQDIVVTNEDYQEGTEAYANSLASITEETPFSRLSEISFTCPSIS